MSRQALNALNHLYILLDAGEKGYAEAAANLNNRGLKMLLKTYARQRSDFKTALTQQLPVPGPRGHSLIAIAAMIHRGRINIFAALTIGEQNREQVVMREILVGERAMLKGYEQALARPLPSDVRDMLQKQHEAVQGVVGQVRDIRGREGKQMVVRLYDTEADAKRAMQVLKQAQFNSFSMQKVPLEKDTEAYDDDRRSALFETILSGAVGGAMWGSVSGALAGFGVLHLPGLGLDHAPLPILQMTWALVALGAIVAGAFVGSVLGIFIGWGIEGGDAHVYDQSLELGRVLLKLEVEQSQAEKARQIMAQINREARSESQQAVA